MKRRIKKKIRKGFISILILLIIFGGAFVGYKYYSSKDSDTPLKVPEKPKEVFPKISKLSLVATGDGLLHNAVYRDAYDEATQTFDFSPHLEMVKDIISSYDLAYYNQETLFGGKQTKMFPNSNAYDIPGYVSYPLFNSPSEFGDAMVDIGFNLVSLASNHSADCTYNSEECIVNSYNYWKSKNIVFSGLNDSQESANTPIIMEKNGIKYTLLSYTNTLNGLDGYITEDYLVNVYSEERVKADIEAIQDKVDVIIVAMHWHKGDAEYTTNASSSNIEIANYLSSLGVDIILGTYSHSLQPFDIINDTVVFYSLGNFLSNQGDLVSSIGYKGIVGVLASMDITKTLYEDGTSNVKVDNIGADLIYTYKEGHKNYLVVPFSKMNSTYNANYKSIYDEYSQILTKLNNNISIKPLSQ